MSALEPGYHDAVNMTDYVSDVICPEPSASTGVLHRLLDQTAEHAHAFHPRLGGLSDDATTRSDLGSAVHSVVLGGATIEYVDGVTRRSGPNKGEVFEPTDWATKDAQEAQAAIRARGNIPMLPFQRKALDAICANARRALAKYGPGRFEQTMVWRDELGVWCRGRPDFLTDDGLYDIDLKSCADASPSAWIDKVLFKGGYHIQAGLRMRGHFALTQRNRDVLFLLAEVEPPYACSVVGLDPAAQYLATSEVGRALKMYAACMKSNQWPSYDDRIHYAAPPAYLERRALERSA